MKHLLPLLLFFFIHIGYGQNVSTKDGVNIGSRSDFISSCASAGEEKVIELKGISFNVKHYCSCITDNLIPTLEFEDINTALKENKLTELFLEDGNLEIILKCLDGHYKVNDSYEFKSENQTEISKSFAQKQCVKEIVNDPEMGAEWNKEMAEEYCECALCKLYSKGFTYKDLKVIENVNSER